MAAHNYPVNVLTVPEDASDIIFFLRVTSDAGAPVPSLAFNSPGLTLDYKIEGQASWST